MSLNASQSQGVQGRLVVVGTGLRMGAHLTAEASYWLKRAEKVLYLVADPVSEALLRELAPGAQSLMPLYEVGKPRLETYEAIITQTLALLEQGHLVCLATYGHPGVFAYPTHESIRRARGKGLEASMLPGISTEDCLFAELGIDPAAYGCQSFEATDFLISRRRFDPAVPLILWQVHMLGVRTFSPKGCPPERVRILAETLAQHYGQEHEVVCYRTPQLPSEEPTLLRVPLSELGRRPGTMAWTLYVPPREPAPIDHEMERRLGMNARA